MQVTCGVCTCTADAAQLESTAAGAALRIAGAHFRAEDQSSNTFFCAYSIPACLHQHESTMPLPRCTSMCLVSSTAVALLLSHFDCHVDSRCSTPTISTPQRP